jgi:ribose/xylose/arabinose/galactoside ABC-type transport system permease subunit
MEAAAPRAQETFGSVVRRIGHTVFGKPGSVRRPLAFLIVAIIISSFVSSDFLKPSNLLALLTSTSFLVMLAVGESFVMLVGMIDLGVESVMEAAGMFVAYLYVFDHYNSIVAMVIGMLFGLGVGALVGFMVTLFRIPSFIVTLGTYWGMAGVALLFNGGNYINPDSVHPARPFVFGGIAQTSFGVSHLIWIALGAVVIGQLVISFTPLGTWIKAAGSDEEAARSVGIRTNLIKILVFMISGFLAVMAGIMITAWESSIYPNTGQGYSLQAIAAVILGGIPFKGGRGTIVGAAIGAIVIGIISDLIVLVGLPALYEYIFVAIILVLAGLQARGGPFVK